MKKRKEKNRDTKTAKQFGVVNYPVGNFIIAVKNACLAGKSEIDVAETKLVRDSSEALKKMGFIGSVEKMDECLRIKIAYKNKKPVLLGAKIVSKPGLRVYMGARELEKIKGPSQYLVTTSRGVMGSREAKKLHLGGEVIAEVW